VRGDRPRRGGTPVPWSGDGPGVHQRQSQRPPCAQVRYRLPPRLRLSGPGSARADRPAPHPFQHPRSAFRCGLARLSAAVRRHHVPDFLESPACLCPVQPGAGRREQSGNRAAAGAGAVDAADRSVPGFSALVRRALRALADRRHLPAEPAHLRRPEQLAGGIVGRNAADAGTAGHQYLADPRRQDRCAPVQSARRVLVSPGGRDRSLAGCRRARVRAQPGSCTRCLGLGRRSGETTGWAR